MAGRKKLASSTDDKEHESAGSAAGEKDADCGGENVKNGKAAVSESKQKQKTTKRKLRDGIRNAQNTEADKGEDQEDTEGVTCTCGNNECDSTSIECEICTKWLHPGCEGLDKEALEAVEKHELFWICTKCKSFLKEFQEVVKKRGRDRKREKRERKRLLGTN